MSVFNLTNTVRMIQHDLGAIREKTNQNHGAIREQANRNCEQLLHLSQKPKQNLVHLFLTPVITWSLSR